MKTLSQTQLEESPQKSDQRISGSSTGVVSRPVEVGRSGKDQNPIVRTRSGKVRGTVVNGVYTFKGISFAAPPYGANRMRPPQPVESWSGVRDALNFGPKSFQPPYPPVIDPSVLPELAGPGEDCLNLNIWSPDPGAAGLPVMVWIPGGGFEFHATSASPWYDGSRFARDGIVCVTINYRVGAEGFLYLGNGSGNFGLLDQIAALEWVRDNIAAFGGDPNNVTVFGESGGAISLAMLLAIPRAEGLFRRAIAQSGAAHCVLSEESGCLVGLRLAKKLGVEATLEAIAALPVDRVLAAQEALKADLIARPDPQLWGKELVASMMLWQPVVDGKIIPRPPIERIAAGAGADVDVIIGTNIDEQRLFLVPGSIDLMTPEALAGAVAMYGLPVEKMLTAYRAAYPKASAGDLFAAIQTDWYWRIPAIRLADAHAKNAKNASTYMYEFAWRTPLLNGRLGACHGLEITFVFDTLGKGTEGVLGADPPQKLADIVHAAWVAFARTGNCGWPRYDLNRRTTMRFDIEPGVVDDPRRPERTLWEGVR
ncbi:MAG TPA: carboxylesterase/lipase family protein [Candidatus Angelobacter sp.]